MEIKAAFTKECLETIGQRMLGIATKIENQDGRMELSVSDLELGGAAVKMYKSLIVDNDETH